MCDTSADSISITKSLCIRLGFILSALLTGGCCPNGCFVLSGDAYLALAYSTLWHDRWEKEGTSTQVRHDDWIACGGDKNGNFAPEKKICFKKKQPMRTTPYLRVEDFLIILCAVCAIKAITTQENVMTTRHPELPPPAVLRDTGS